MDESEETFNMYPNKGIIYIYGFLAFAALCFCLYIIYGGITQNGYSLVFGIIPIIAIFYYVSRIKLYHPANEPFISLNEEGIFIRDKGLMPWNTIKQTELTLKHRKHRYLNITFNTQEKKMSYFLEKRYFDDNFGLLEEQLQAFSSRYISKQ